MGVGGIAPSWRGGIQPTPQTNLVEARSEGHPCGWVAALSAWGISIAYQRRRKAILAFRSGDGNLPRQDCHSAGARAALGATERYVKSLYRFWASLGGLYTAPGAVVYRSPAYPTPLVGAPCGAQPATPPDQIEGTDATRGPGRPKRLVVVTQGHRGRPAAGSRRRSPSYKFTSTKMCAGHGGR